MRRWLDEEQEAQIKDKSIVNIDFIVKPRKYFRPFSAWIWRTDPQTLSSSSQLSLLIQLSSKLCLQQISGEGWNMPVGQIYYLILYFTFVCLTKFKGCKMGWVPQTSLYSSVMSVATCNYAVIFILCKHFVYCLSWNKENDSNKNTSSICISRQTRILCANTDILLFWQTNQHLWLVEVRICSPPPSLREHPQARASDCRSPINLFYLLWS